MHELTSRTIPEGNAGARETANEMARLMVYGSKLAAVQRLVYKLCHYAPSAEDAVRVCWQWVRDNIAYDFDADETARVNDAYGAALPADAELVRSAEVTLEQRRGDCDCQSVLLGSMLLACNRAPIAILLTRADSMRDDFSHVLLATQINGEWLPIDTIDPELEFGVMPDDVLSVEILPIVASGLGANFISRGRDKVKDAAKRFARNPAGDLIDAVGNIVDASGKVLKTVAEQIASGSKTLLDDAGKPVELTFNFVNEEAFRPVYEGAGNAAQNIGDLAEEAVDVEWGGGSFGMPRVDINPRAATLLAAGIGATLIGVPPLMGAGAAVPIASSNYNDDLWELKDELNAWSTETFGAPIIPTSIPEYMAQVGWVAANVPLPGNLNDVLAQAVDAYNMARMLDHLQKMKEAAEAAARAAAEAGIFIVDEDEIDAADSPESGSTTRDAAGSSLKPGLGRVALTLTGIAALGAGFLAYRRARA